MDYYTELINVMLMWCMYVVWGGLKVKQLLACHARMNVTSFNEDGSHHDLYSIQIIRTVSAVATPVSPISFWCISNWHYWEIFLVLYLYVISKYNVKLHHTFLNFQHCIYSLNRYPDLTVRTCWRSHVIWRQRGRRTRPSSCAQLSSHSSFSSRAFTVPGE